MDANVGLLVVAGFVAGLLNAVAGGGSLISFPALGLYGLSNVAANVSNTVALVPGYLGGAFGFRERLRHVDRALRMALAASAIGAVGGAALILLTPARLFTSLVPWLILLGTALFAVQPLVSKHVRRLHAGPAGQGTTTRVGVGGMLALTCSCVYGAYFGAGLGVIVLAVLGFVWKGDLRELNAIKNAMTLTVNGLAAVIFAAFGPVNWSAALFVAVGSVVGGYSGSVIARRVRERPLRVAIVGIGLAVSVKYFVT